MPDPRYSISPDAERDQTATDPVMPPVETGHRYFDQSGQPTPIMPQVKQPEQAPVQPQPQQSEPSTPDYKLWQQLNKSELYTKNYDDFKKQFNNQSSIDNLYKGLNDSELYTKTKDDFYNQFFQHLPSKEVQESSRFIGDYINSPKAASAINKLTGDVAANDFYQNLQNSGSNKKDATRVAIPVPLRLPKDIEASGQEFAAKAAQNPDEWRKVLTVAKRQNPEDAPKIDAAMYITDASKRPHVPGAVSYYADQMKAGNMMYDLNKKQIIKPVGPIDALFNGMKQHSDAMDKYDYLTSHNDNDIIDFLNKEGQNDPDKPVLKAANAIPSLFEMQGANAMAMTKMAGPGAVLSRFGPEAAAFAMAIGAGAGAQDFHHTVYANTLSERYHELVGKGVDPHDALARSKEDANTAAMLAAGQGIALSAGGAIGKELEFSPVRYSKANLNALSDIGNNIKSIAKVAAPEIATQAGIAGTIKAINNAQQGKAGGEIDDAGAMALFTAGMIGLKVPGAFKGGNITPSGRANLMDLYAKTPEPVVDAALQNAVKNEALTPMQAGELKVEINTHKAATEGKPDFTSTVTPEAEDFIQKYDDGQLSHIKTPTEAIMKVAKANGIEEPKEGEAKLTVEDIYNKLKNRQSSGRTETIETPDITANLSDIMKKQYEADPEAFLKEVADHAHGGVMFEGKWVSSRPGAEKEYGKEMVDAAIAKYPEHSYTEPAPEKPHHTVSTPEITNVKPTNKTSDADIENRMQEIENNPKHSKEFDALEKEMESRERASVFNVPLENVNDAVDALMKKEKEMPNGYGSFIEKRDARETKAVANKYLNPKEISDNELKEDFYDAIMGNPDTWYADGLKLREAIKEATNRGIETSELVKRVEDKFIKDHYSPEEAKAVVARKLKPIFENIKPKDNAEDIRSNTGQGSQEWGTIEGSQDNSSQNLQLDAAQKTEPSQVEQQARQKKLREIAMDETKIEIPKERKNGTKFNSSELIERNKIWNKKKELDQIINCLWP